MKRILYFLISLIFSFNISAEEIVLFTEDFEWFSTDTNINSYVSAEGVEVSDNVGNKIYKGAYNPFSTIIKSPDGLSVWDLLIKKGYNVYSTDEKQAKRNISCAKNYLKIGTMGYTAALALPPMEAAGDGVKNVHLSFDWTPMTDGGKAIWDKTTIVAEVMNGTNIKLIPIEPINKIDSLINNVEAKDPYQWYRVDKDLAAFRIPMMAQTIPIGPMNPAPWTTQTIPTTSKTHPLASSAECSDRASRLRK